MDEKNLPPLASEMYSDLKKTNQFLRRLLVGVIIGALVVILILIGVICAQHFYHIYQWSQFDTIVVDSGDGGNANLVQGDNTGGIYNGTNSSENPQDGQVQGDEGQG